MQEAGLKPLLTKHWQKKLWTFTMSCLLSQSLRDPRMSKTGQWLYKCSWMPQILMCYVCHQIENFMDRAGLALWVALREQQPWTNRRKYPPLCLVGVLQAKNYHGSLIAQDRGILTLGKTWATHCKVDYIDTTQQWGSDAIAQVFQSYKAVFKLDPLLEVSCLGKSLSSRSSRLYPHCSEGAIVGALSVCRLALCTAHKSNAKKSHRCPQWAAQAA